MRSILLAATLSITILAGAYAQRGNMRQGNRPSGTVEGNIFDATNNQPLEFANVSLFRVKDSSLATGAIADAKGHYLIEDVKPGKYYLVADFIGYRKEEINSIVLRPPNMSVKLDPIKLEISAQTLEGVNVTAEKNRVEYKIDRKVINVSKDINATGGTAVDVLKNTPSVEVDIEGNVSLRGSENFKVYIDGKPTVLDGNDLLQQLPASSIDQIEIVTNPSVKFDPDGSGGIINVLMKKDHKAGLNGIVNTSFSTDESKSADFLLNYRTGKFKWFVGADYRDRRFNGTGNIYRETYADTTYFYEADRERDFTRDGYSVKGGFDYEIDDKNTFSLSVTIGNYGFGIDMNSEINTFTDPVSEEEFLFSETLFERSGDYIQTTANYDLKFNDNGHRLQAMVYYSAGKDDELNIQKDFITDESFNVVSSSIIDEGIENTETEDEDQVRFKLDYTLPFENENKLEAGVQTRLRYESSEYEFSFYDTETDDWVEDPDFYNEFDFDRNITSAYTTYSGSIGMFGVQAGLRGEYTDRVIANITGDSYEINRWDFFPSLHTSLEFDKNHKLMASYSKRIRRPRGWFLDPVISYRDRYTLRQGNPELEPEYTNAYELSFMKRFKSGFATVEAFYKHTTNEITRFNDIYEGNILLMTFENVNEEDRMGLELMVNSQVFKWWKLNISGSGYRFSVSDLQDGEEITNESTNWSARMNNDFIFSKNSRMQISGFYRGPSASIQGERGSFFYTSAAYRHDFMNKKLNMTVSVQDIFGTMGHEMITDQPSYYIKQDFNRQPRVVRLSLSYKINDYKKKRGERGSGRGNNMEMEGEGGF